MMAGYEENEKLEHVQSAFGYIAGGVVVRLRLSIGNDVCFDHDHLLKPRRFVNAAVRKDEK